MSKLYLITGFLGAGKTTFLKNFIKQFEGQRLHLIINEFGKEGVDGTILQDMGSVLDEINNGSIFCACRLDKFEEVLERALESEPDVIIVEASGLSNPMNVRKILGQQEKFHAITYKGSICLVDARHFLKVYETAVVVKRQLSVGDLILINKVDLATEEQLEQLRKIIALHRPGVPVFTTSYGAIEPAWLELMGQRGKREEAERLQSADITLKKYLLILAPPNDLAALQKFVEMFLEDTYRVKGFVEVQGHNYLVNCVGNLYQMEPFEGMPAHVNELVVLSGKGLPVGKSIKRAMEWYPQMVIEAKR